MHTSDARVPKGNETSRQGCICQVPHIPQACRSAPTAPTLACVHAARALCNRMHGHRGWHTAELPPMRTPGAHGGHEVHTEQTMVCAYTQSVLTCNPQEMHNTSTTRVQCTNAGRNVDTALCTRQKRHAAKRRPCMTTLPDKTRHATCGAPKVLNTNTMLDRKPATCRIDWIHSADNCVTCQQRGKPTR